MAYVGKGSTAFTPALNFGGGTTGITYSSRSGSYVVVGSLVFFNIKIVLSSKGSSTGQAFITGCPLAPAQEVIGGAVEIANITFTLYQYVAANIRDNSGFQMYFDRVQSAGATAFISDTEFANNSEIYVSGSFYI